MSDDCHTLQQQLSEIKALFRVFERDLIQLSDEGATGTEPYLQSLARLRSLRSVIDGKSLELRINLERMRSDRTCSALRETLQALAVWIRKQPSVGEESLTDWFLYQIAERVPSVRYVKFTRWDEARKTGADWEWWFVSRHLSLGMRIQAKRLTASDNYPALAYANRHGMQIERLREDATRRGLLAFYAFYADGTGQAAVKCGGMANAGLDEGAFLAGANGLYANYIRSARSKLDAAMVLRESNPLSCIACCPIAMGFGDYSVERLYDHIRRYFPDVVNANLLPDSIDRDGGDRLGLHAEPPSYVSALMQVDSSTVPEWWESQHRAPVDEAQALLVFDLREQGA